jgi:UDP:flavonoid glycosyltransferase YjiC (YdhE family)
MMRVVSRVLLFPFAPGGGLAHVGACITLARELERRGHETVLAYGGDRTDVVAAEVGGFERVDEVPYERTVGDTVAHWFETPAQLVQLVEGDRRLIERLRPDAVVVDTRLSASYASELSGVPDLALMHFLRLMKWYREPEPWRRRLREVRRPHRVGAALRRRRDPDLGGGKALDRVVAQARQALGLPPLELPWRGSIVACTTTPLLDPAELPSHWRYVGPVTWSSADSSCPPPTRGSRPLVYVTQGTTGSPELLRRIVLELAHEPFDLGISTAGVAEADLRALAPAATLDDFLPSARWLAAADVAVIHGGHLTASEAHLAGTPVAVVPFRADQWAWADRVERLGTGIALRAPLLPGAVRRAVHRLLRRERYRLAARRVAAHLAGWDGPARAADLVEELVR